MINVYNIVLYVTQVLIFTMIDLLLVITLSLLCVSSLWFPVVVSV